MVSPLPEAIPLSVSASPSFSLKSLLTSPSIVIVLFATVNSLMVTSASTSPPTVISAESVPGIVTGPVMLPPMIRSAVTSPPSPLLFFYRTRPPRSPEMSHPVRFEKLARSLGSMSISSTSEAPAVPDALSTVTL